MPGAVPGTRVKERDPGRFSRISESGEGMDGPTANSVCLLQATWGEHQARQSREERPLTQMPRECVEFWGPGDSRAGRVVQ